MGCRDVDDETPLHADVNQVNPWGSAHSRRSSRLRLATRCPFWEMVQDLNGKILRGVCI